MKNSYSGAGSLTSSNVHASSVNSNLNSALAMPGLTPLRRDLLTKAKNFVAAGNYNAAAYQVWYLLGSPANLKPGTISQNLQAHAAKSSASASPKQVAVQNQPVTTTATVKDTSGRTVNITQAQANALKNAKANSSQSYGVIPVEVANSGSNWWINSNGAYEWNPVTQSDRDHLAQINKQRARSSQHLAPLTTLQTGAAKSDAYTLKWETTGGQKTYAQQGSGDKKVAAVKAKSTTNSNASAKTDTAQTNKAEVKSPTKVIEIKSKPVEQKKNITGAQEVKPTSYGAYGGVKSNVLDINPKTGSATLIATQKAFKDIKPFQSVKQIDTDKAVSKAVSSAKKVNKNASQEYLDGVANTARRSKMSVVDVAKEDLSRANTQVAKAINLPSLNQISKVRDDFLSGFTVKVTNKDDKLTGKKASVRSYTLKDVQRNQAKKVDNSAVLSGIRKFGEDEYNDVRSKPVSYTGKTALEYAGGYALGMGTKVAKVASKAGLIKVATKTPVGKRVALTGAKYVGAAIDTGLATTMGVGLVANEVAYRSSDKATRVSESEHVADYLKLGKSLVIGGVGYSRGNKGIKLSDPSLPTIAKKSTGVNVRTTSTKSPVSALSPRKTTKSTALSEKVTNRTENKPVSKKQSNSNIRELDQQLRMIDLELSADRITSVKQRKYVDNSKKIPPKAEIIQPTQHNPMSLNERKLSRQQRKTGSTKAERNISKANENAEKLKRVSPDTVTSSDKIVRYNGQDYSVPRKLNGSKLNKYIKSLEESRNEAMYNLNKNISAQKKVDIEYDTWLKSDDGFAANKELKYREAVDTGKAIHARNNKIYTPSKSAKLDDSKYLSALKELSDTLESSKKQTTPRKSVNINSNKTTIIATKKYERVSTPKKALSDADSKAYMKEVMSKDTAQSRALREALNDNPNFRLSRPKQTNYERVITDKMADKAENRQIQRDIRKTEQDQLLKLNSSQSRTLKEILNEDPTYLMPSERKIELAKLTDAQKANMSKKARSRIKANKTSEWNIKNTLKTDTPQSRALAETLKEQGRLSKYIDDINESVLNYVADKSGIVKRGVQVTKTSERSTQRQTGMYRRDAKPALKQKSAAASPGSYKGGDQSMFDGGVWKDLSRVEKWSRGELKTKFNDRKVSKAELNEASKTGRVTKKSTGIKPKAFNTRIREFVQKSDKMNGVKGKVKTNTKLRESIGQSRKLTRVTNVNYRQIPAHKVIQSDNTKVNIKQRDRMTEKIKNPVSVKNKETNVELVKVKQAVTQIQSVIQSVDVTQIQPPIQAQIQTPIHKIVETQILTPTTETPHPRTPIPKTGTITPPYKNDVIPKPNIKGRSEPIDPRIKVKDGYEIIHKKKVKSVKLSSEEADRNRRKIKRNIHNKLGSISTFL